jgi:hypothetical protein
MEEVLHSSVEQRSPKEIVKSGALRYKTIFKDSPVFFSPKTPEDLLQQIDSIHGVESSIHQVFALFGRGSLSLEDVEVQLRHKITRQDSIPSHGFALENAANIVSSYVRGPMNETLSQSFGYNAHPKHKSPATEEVNTKINRDINLLAMKLKYDAVSSLPDFDKPNPYNNILELITKGALNLRFYENSLRADFPILIDSAPYLACYFEGKELTKYHPYYSSCSDFKNFHTLS